jgi:four helix bundle protein
MGRGAGDIDERAFEFLCGVIRFVRSIQPRPGTWRLADQMVAASGSIARIGKRRQARHRARNSSVSTEIALRSAKETVLWLRACVTTHIGDPQLAAKLLDEGRQLARILASIVITAKGNS